MAFANLSYLFAERTFNPCASSSLREPVFPPSLVTHHDSPSLVARSITDFERSFGVTVKSIQSFSSFPLIGEVMNFPSSKRPALTRSRTSTSSGTMNLWADCTVAWKGSPAFMAESSGLIVSSCEKAGTAASNNKTARMNERFDIN